MSALLIEFLEDTLPSQLPLLQLYDKVLIMLPENAPRLSRLFKDHPRVSYVSDFIRNDSKECVLEISSEYVRGAITGELYAQYDLSICSSRSSLCKQLFPSVQLYPLQVQEPSTEVERTETSVVAMYVTPSALPKPSAEEEDPLVIQKLCNAYLSCCLASFRMRVGTVYEAKLQILALLRGAFLRHVPTVVSEERAVEEIFHLMKSKGYFSIDGTFMRYNERLCKNIEGSMPLQTCTFKKAARTRFGETAKPLSPLRPISSNVSQRDIGGESSNWWKKGSFTDDKEARMVRSFESRGSLASTTDELSGEAPEFKPNSTELQPSSVEFKPNSRVFKADSEEFKPNSEEFKPDSTYLNYHTSNMIERVLAWDDLGSIKNLREEVHASLSHYEREERLFLAAKEKEIIIQTVLDFISEGS
jgi:hypothetical protein